MTTVFLMLGFRILLEEGSSALGWILMAWLLHLFFEEFNVLSVFKSPMAIIGLDTLGFCNLSDSVRIRSSQGMLEATQRGVLCIMISKGEPSFWVLSCVFDLEFATAVYHLDLGWTGLVSMGAMFFLPFLGTGHFNGSI